MKRLHTFTVMAVALIASACARPARSIVEQLDGKSTDWMEKVSEEQYNMPVRGRESSATEGGQEDPQ